MTISTRLTELLKVEHPILLAPMDVVADGKLAAAVSRAGGFGIMVKQASTLFAGANRYRVSE
jgi:nitronate monooxygenase